MTIYLKQSTASQEVPLGYFVDSTDGDTEKTALTINNTDIKLWKAGATALANKNSGGATHIANGIYYAVLDATDTDTLGSLVIFVHVAAALTVRLECVVLTANIYDSLIAGTDLFDVSVTQWLGTAAATPTVAGVPEVDLTHIAGSAVSTSTAQLGVNAVQAGGTAWGSGAITAASIATGAIDADAIADNAIDAGAIADGAITAAKVATGAIDADAIAADAVTAIQSGLATSASIAALNNLSAAQVNTEVDTALADINLDHLIKIAVDTDFPTTVHLNSVVGHLADNGSSATFDRATDSLEALQAEHDSTQSAIAALNNLSSAQAQTAAAAALTAYDPPTNAEMEARTLIAANYATAAALDTVDNFLDTEILAIKTVTDALPDAGALTTIQADLDNIQTRIPAALTAGGNMKADVLALNGSTTAASRLASSAATIVSGAAVTGTLSTTQMTTNLTEGTDDHYNGRIIIWTSGVLTDQATDITDYNGTTKMLTYTAVTEAPSNSDSFVIV